LHRAADLLKTLTARVIAASDEEQLWRYKYETLTRHADALEGECDALKHDIEGHLSVTSSILTERDALRASLQSRESEISELRDAFDREREALKATAKVRDEEVEQLRRAFEDERGELKAAIKAGEQSLAELRLALEGECAGFQTRVKASGDELAAFRVASEHERDALTMKVDALEAKRAELRSAFERISDLRIQTAGSGSSVPGKPELEAQARPIPAQRREMDSAVKETSAVVPKTTLRQVRAQFEYLAKECIPRGDIASQVMCELGAHTMDLALTAGGETDRLPVDEVALSILAPSGSTSLATAAANDQRTTSRDCEQRRYNLVDTHSAEHDVRPFPQWLQEKSAGPIPRGDGQCVAAWRECAGPKHDERGEADKPPCHFHELHGNSWLSNATRVMQVDAEPSAGFSPCATAVENASESDPETAREHAQRHVIPQDEQRDLQPSCCRE
jgi:predicted  nucleic acid-binding Zn-ribbon protein